MRLIVGGLYCARDSWLGKSLVYIQNTPPMVSAVMAMPSVTKLKIAPKKEKMKRIKRTPLPDCRFNIGGGGNRVKALGDFPRSFERLQVA